jgi:hypothetical protein
MVPQLGTARLRIIWMSPNHGKGYKEVMFTKARRLLFILTCGSTLIAQVVVNNNGTDARSSVHPSITEADVKFGMMKNLINVNGPLTVGSPQLHRMGDEAASTVLRVLGSLPSSTQLTDQQKANIIEIVKKSFEQPKSITSRSNVRPNATSILLNMLEQNTDNAELKNNIAQARQSAGSAFSHLADQ